MKVARAELRFALTRPIQHISFREIHMSDQSTLGALLLAAKKQQEVTEVLRPAARVGTPLENLLATSIASFDSIVIQLLTQHLNEVSVKLDPKKGSWEKEHAILCISYGSFQFRIPTKFIVGDIQKKVIEKMEQTMVRIINGQLELHDGSSVAMVDVSDGMIGVQKLSDGFALLTLEAYKRLNLEILGIAEKMDKQTEYKVVPSTGYWNGEDYSGLYIQLMAKTSLGDICISYCFWHDESSTNDHLRLRVTDWTLSLSKSEAISFWTKAIEKTRKHIEGASRFSWDNTPEKYSPNQSAVEGVDGPGFQLASLYPYSF